MKKILIIFTLVFLPIQIGAQVIDWNNFNERKMDTVMFETMNAYVKSIHNGDSLIWSPVVQKDIMTRNYNVIKKNPRLEIHMLHNMEWCNTSGHSVDLPYPLKMKIVTENANSKFTCNNALPGNKWGVFEYYEILQKVQGVKYGQTYQELALFFIWGWNKSIEGHAEIMNANYKNKVIVGVITLYDKESKSTIISFVHIT